MSKFAQIVLGPAGSGKSTYCQIMQNHLRTMKRNCHVFNMDPAAEYLPYEPSVDIRNMIDINDVIEADDVDFGPNGGLVFCLEYLHNNLTLLDDLLGDYPEDYLLIDCPGQIEVFTHLPFMRKIVEHLQRAGYNMVSIYLMDIHFVDSRKKLVAGMLACLSTMIQVELPHLAILSKCDLNDDYEEYLEVIPGHLQDELDKEAPQHKEFNVAMIDLLEEFGGVDFLPLSLTDENMMMHLLTRIDLMTGYDQLAEMAEPNDMVF
ncbi:hypothetical protein PCE1_000827 [Barthelona sp. PCE]